MNSMLNSLNTQFEDHVEDHNNCMFLYIGCPLNCVTDRKVLIYFYSHQK